VWPPAVEEGAGGANTIVGVAAVAVAATAFCCGPAAMVVGRGGSPVAVASHAARSALKERRLIDTDVSDVSAFAGARAGTNGLPCK
jgi:hypothetical protein